MPEEKKIVTVKRSAGGECLYCWDPVRANEVVVAVNLKIPVMFSSINVEKELHVHCTEDLVRMFSKAVKFARGVK